MVFDDETTRYYDRLAAGSKAARLPEIIDRGSVGRAYPKPDIREFRKLAEISRKLTFWRRF